LNLADVDTHPPAASDAASMNTEEETPPTTTTPESRAQLAYTAYGKSVGWRTHDGGSLPLWSNLAKDRQAGWIEATRVIWELKTEGRTSL
jgi:YD repeat-containing protein